MAQCGHRWRRWSPASTWRMLAPCTGGTWTATRGRWLMIPPWSCPWTPTAPTLALLIPWTRWMEVGDRLGNKNSWWVDATSSGDFWWHQFWHPILWIKSDERWQHIDVSSDQENMTTWITWITWCSSHPSHPSHPFSLSPSFPHQRWRLHARPEVSLPGWGRAHRFVLHTRTGGVVGGSHADHRQGPGTGGFSGHFPGKWRRNTQSVWWFKDLSI